MRWIKYRKKDDKYRQWSTVVNAYTTDWLTRDEMLKYIEKRWKKELKDKLKYERENFPKGWGNKDKPYTIFN